MTKPHEPTEAKKAEVRALASMGIPHDQISAYIGIDKKTLYKYYREILDRAKIQANMKMAQCLFQQAQNGSTPAAIFWLKIQAGWQEKQVVDVTTNGESINKPSLDVSKLSDEQLRNLDTIIAQASESGTGT
jgi:hypothetical protein